MKKQILQLSVLTLITLITLTSKINAQSWKLVGNSATNPNTDFLGTTDGQPLVFRTNNVERMRLKAGSLGIGTKKPEAKLHVVGGSYVSLTSPGYLILGDVKSSNMALDFNVIQARNNGSASSLYLNYYGGYAYVGPGAALQVTTGNMAMYGIAGINGASNASYALNVNATSSLYGIQVTDPVDGYVLYSSKSGINDGIYVTKSSTSTSTASIEGNATGSAIGVQGGANTGIGVYGYSSSNYGVYGSSSTNEGIYGYTGGGGSFAGVHGFCASTGYGVWGEGTSGSGVYGTSSSGYAGYFAGNVYSTGSYVGSDLKLKKNITDVTSAMDIINQLHPKKYDFRDDGNYKLMHLPKGDHYGLIAQEVEKVLPNIVQDTKFETPSGQSISALVQPSDKGKENGSTTAQSSAKAKSEEIDFKAVNYTELIPLLIKAMQEQQAVIDKQQKQIDQLMQMAQNNNGTSNASDAKSATVSGAYLLQNAPNPFTQNTTVRCYVPASVKQAQLIVYGSNGNLVKSYTLNSGMNSTTIAAGTLSSGQYVYSLIVDGKKIDTKNMSLTK